jgi:hypothetical protein
VATLHQPRQEIFDLLDCLILLAPGGKVAYFGPAFDMIQHFSRLKYTCPVKSNISDFVMDVLAGYVKPDDANKVPPVKDIIDTITSNWSNNYRLTQPEIRFSASDQTHNFRGVRQSFFANSKLGEPSNHENSPSYWFLFQNTASTSLAREMKIYERTFSKTIITSYALTVLGLLIALLFGSMALSANSYGKPTSPNIGGQVSAAQLTFSLLIMTSGLRLFDHDALVRSREEAAGIHILPLFLGKLIASGFEIIFYPFAFLTGYFSFVEAASPFRHYMATFILLQLSIMGLANLISVSFQSSIKSFVASGILVILWAFGGISPTLSEIEERMGPLVIFNYLSPFKWSFELQHIFEFEMYSEAWESGIDEAYDNQGWNKKDTKNCIGMLVFYWIMTNSLAYFVLEMKKGNYHLLSVCYGYVFGNRLMDSSNSSGSINPSIYVINAELIRPSTELSEYRNPLTKNNDLSKSQTNHILL